MVLPGFLDSNAGVKCEAEPPPGPFAGTLEDDATSSPSTAAHERNLVIGSLSLMIDRECPRLPMTRRSYRILSKMGTDQTIGPKTKACSLIDTSWNQGEPKATTANSISFDQRLDDSALAPHALAGIDRRITARKIRTHQRASWSRAGAIRSDRAPITRGQLRRQSVCRHSADTGYLAQGPKIQVVPDFLGERGGTRTRDPMIKSHRRLPVKR